MKNASFGSWFIALCVVSIPVVILTTAGKDNFAWGLVFVILLGAALLNVDLVSRSINTVTKAVKSG